MINQDKLSSAFQFVLGSTFLFIGLMNFSLALTWRPLDNQFIGGVLGIPLAFLLTLLFGIGWWLEWLFEKIVPDKGRNTAVLFLSSVLLVYILIALVSFFIPLGFFHFTLIAGDSIVLSSFWFQLSRIRPETLAKIRNRT